MKTIGNRGNRPTAAVIRAQGIDWEDQMDQGGTLVPRVQDHYFITLWCLEGVKIKGSIIILLNERKGFKNDTMVRSCLDTITRMMMNNRFEGLARSSKGNKEVFCWVKVVQKITELGSDLVYQLSEHRDRSYLQNNSQEN